MQLILLTAVMNFLILLKILFISKLFDKKPMMKEFRIQEIFYKNSQGFHWFIDQKLLNQDLLSMFKSYLKLHTIT